MIIDKCPEKYTTTLKHRRNKFHQSKPIDPLTHIYTEYGTTSSSYLTANLDRMTASWNKPTPIADLFQQLNDGNIFSRRK